MEESEQEQITQPLTKSMWAVEGFANYVRHNKAAYLDLAFGIIGTIGALGSLALVIASLCGAI